MLNAEYLQSPIIRPRSFIVHDTKHTVTAETECTTSAVSSDPIPGQIRGSHINTSELVSVDYSRESTQLILKFFIQIFPLFVLYNQQ